MSAPSGIHRGSRHVSTEAALRWCCSIRARRTSANRCTCTLNFGLLAGILRELAGSVAAIPKDDIAHREQLADALAELQRVLRPS